MSRPARLGLLALAVIIVGGIAIYFGVKILRGGGGYQIGVRFPTAAGVAPGAQVFLSGVVIGSVTTVQILPDASVDFIINVFRDTDIPKNATFSVQSGLTGSPSVAITPPARHVAQNQIPTPMPAGDVLPKRILPVPEQPVGSPALTLETFMRQSRSLGDRAYSMLAQARPYGKRLADHLQNARTNTAATTQELRGTLPAVMSSLQSTIAKAKADMQHAQSALRERNQPKITALAAAFELTARDMQQVSQALAAIKHDPRLQSNLRSASAQVRIVAANLAKLSHDMQMISGNAQTKAQLRDASARLRAIAQKF